MQKIKHFKRHANLMHTKRRMLERFGLEINGEEVDELCRQITHNEATHVRKLSLSRTLWRVMFKEVEVYVVYDKNQKNIVTVKRPDQIYDTILPTLFDKMKEKNE